MTPAEFDRAVAALAARGIPIDEGPRRRGTGRSLYFKDPAGNQVEVHQL